MSATCQPAFRIFQEQGVHRAALEALAPSLPQAGEVLVRVTHSSVNYKDALAGTGTGKILKRFPLTGGIDAAGRVEVSQHPDYRPGDQVIATGWGLSVDHDGGYAAWLCVPGDWLVPMPAGLDARTAMILGTAGFTAALALQRMQRNGQQPALGPILVTGASGGVGCIAVTLLAQLGYPVVAMSGKPERDAWLRQLGATQVLGREALAAATRPLEKAEWGGAIDTVGGALLAQIIRTLKPGGCIAAIGLAGGATLHTTVMPFILRGISLLGCNSVDVAQPLRQALWSRLGGDWRPRDLEALVSETIGLADLPDCFARMLAGRTHGRVLVEIG